MARDQRNLKVSTNDEQVGVSLQHGDTIYSKEAGAYRTIKLGKDASPTSYETMTPYSGDEEAVGITADRPATPDAGFYYFDTTLALPIWYDGSGWVNATGTTV